MKQIFTILVTLVCVAFTPVSGKSSYAVDWERFQPADLQPNAQCDVEPQTGRPVMITCGDWVDADAGIVAGWSIDLNRLEGVQSVQLLQVDYMGSSTYLGNVTMTVYRPDVNAVFGAWGSVGWGVSVGHALPAGHYVMIITDIPFSGTCWNTFDVRGCGYISNQIRFDVTR